MSETTESAGTTTTDAGTEARTAEEVVVDATATQAATETEPVADAGSTTEADAPVYEFSAPEGMTLDSDAVEEFKGIAKDLKLDQAGAQKIADVAVKMAQKQVEAHATLVEGWVNQVKADKDLGGDKLEATLATARKAVEAYGGQEVKDVLNSTGLGNHPAFVKMFHAFGMTLKEDTFVAGGNAPQETDTAKRMFPSMN